MIPPAASVASTPSIGPKHRAIIERLRARLARLPDSRMPGRVHHRLDEVLMIAFCSVLADNEAFTDMELFAQSQLPWLRGFLTLKNGAPSSLSDLAKQPQKQLRSWRWRHCGSKDEA